MRDKLRVKIYFDERKEKLINANFYILDMIQQGKVSSEKINGMLQLAVLNNMRLLSALYSGGMSLKEMKVHLLKAINLTLLSDGCTVGRV